MTRKISTTSTLAATHATPGTFAVNGKQYVALAAGWGGWLNGLTRELAHAPMGHTLIIFGLPTRNK
ncbi:hypothetical protein [Rhodospirillaceae bacterium SYSU D60014]|uniref:hypothetical protein n=1 Tax=Virgifigura deserti TaxID=2268457 RepID=UPI000E66F8AA